MRSKLSFCYLECGYSDHVWTDLTDNGIGSLYKSTGNFRETSGNCFNSFQEVLAAIGIRFISYKTHESIRIGSLDGEICQLAELHMIESNGIEEEIAIKKGQCD